MRSKIASVLIGLGVFLVVAAVLARAYAYPSLAKVPANYESITELEATGAQVFNSDPEVLATETTDLAITARTVADSGAEAPDGVAVWVTSTTLTREDGSVFQRQRERTAFDDQTGAAVDCERCDPWVEVAADVQKPVEREGLTLKFPFRTEKKDYLVWDGTVGEAVNARFEGEEKIQGLTVYKFVQTIEPQVVESREVPGSVFGAAQSAVLADMWYGMTRTYYIEPTTGSPINRVEERQQELRYGGVTVPAFTGTVRYTEDEVTSSVKDTKSKAMMLGGMNLLFPVLLLLLGLLVVAGGLFLGRSANRDRDGADNEDKALVGV